MKLYKMRSLENLEFVIDIIFNERLYCAHFADLNDPFEGVYLAGSHFSPGLLEREDLGAFSIKGMDREPANRKFDRICSLSGNFQDIRLWSHYGDGHRGITIEIDFTGHEADAKPVRYVDRFENYGEADPRSIPVGEILSQKTVQWEYEQEFRIVQQAPFYSVENRISAIYLGSRTSKDRQSLLEKLVPESIPIYTTKINVGKLAVENNELVSRKQMN